MNADFRSIRKMAQVNRKFADACRRTGQIDVAENAERRADEMDARADKMVDAILYEAIFGNEPEAK